MQKTTDSIFALLHTYAQSAHSYTYAIPERPCNSSTSTVDTVCAVNEFLGNAEQWFSYFGVCSQVKHIMVVNIGVRCRAIVAGCRLKVGYRISNIGMISNGDSLAIYR